MPPRFRYWTVVIDGVPTAFRAHESHELVPTLRQLQRHARSAILMWFENGRLWRSPDEARLSALERRAAERPAKALHRPRRPGGERRPRRPPSKKGQ
jgi:hypothetical protein